MLAQPWAAQLAQLRPLAEYWAYIVLGAVLVAASITDVKSGKIWNAVTIPAALIGLLGHTVVGGINGAGGERIGLIGSSLGLAIGFLPLLTAWKMGGIGGGDAKLMGAVGALTGWRFTLAAMFYGFLVAGIMALIVMLRHKILGRTLKRVWRFLLMAASGGRPVDPADDDSPTIAFGLALCVGSALAMLEKLFGGPFAGRLFGF